MESVERFGIELHGVEHRPLGGKKHTVEHDDVLSDAAGVDNIHEPFARTRRMMRNPPAQIRMPAPAPGRPGHLRGAHYADDVEPLQMMLEARGKIGGEYIDIIVR